VSKLLKERWLRLAFADDSTTVITEKKDPYDSCWDGYERVPGKKKDEKGSCRKEGSDPMGDEGNNLWDNIRAKDERIKKGSGEKKAKPGDDDYPATLDVNEHDESLNETDETDENLTYAIASEVVKDPDAKEVEVDGEKFPVKMSKKKAEEIAGDESVDEAIEEAVANWKEMIVESGFDKEKKDKMKANSPRYLKKGEPGYGKKQKVVKATHKGEEKIVKFGDANMKNKSNVKSNRENFRKRHKCADKSKESDWDTASYWACKDW